MASEHVVVNQAMVDYIFAELQWRSVEFKKTGAIFVFNGDVVKSDTAISAEVKASLRNAVKSLENIPEIYKDYHPGSSGQVLDLVHPSLFPLVYGRSRALQDRSIGIHDAIKSIGEGKTLEIRSEKETHLDPKSSSADTTRDTPYSQNFQWLPADVDISTGEAKYVIILPILINSTDLLELRVTSTIYIQSTTQIYIMSSIKSSLRPFLCGI